MGRSGDVRGLVSLLVVTALPVAPARSTFTGTITDSVCASTDHSHMRMGSTDADCTVACISAHGATYVLYDGKNAYGLSNQERAEKFAARKVTVVGTLDVRTKTIQMDSMSAAR